MLFSEIELKKIVDRGYADMSLEDEIYFNIMNFINCIHFNKDDFINSAYNSQFFGDTEMTFKKKHGSLVGHCRVNIKKTGEKSDYLFTNLGFEKLQEVVQE